MCFLVCRRLEVTLLVSVVTSLWFTLYKQQIHYRMIPKAGKLFFMYSDFSESHHIQSVKRCNKSLMSGFITSKQYSVCTKRSLG